MSKVHNFLKKHWKPPYKLFKYTILLCLISGSITAVNSQTEDNDDPNNDDVVVHTESTAYSIRFFIEDEKYELLSVTCKNLINLDEIEAPQEGLICMDLSPCSKYLATVKIKNETGNEETKTIDAETLYAEPSTELNVPITYQDSIQLSWISTNPTCIAEFKLKLTGSNQNNEYELKSNEFEKNIGNLKPCDEYKIELLTYDREKRLTSNQTDKTQTLYAEPGDLTVTVEKVGNTQLKIKWNTPENETCIDEYIIQWFLMDCEAPIQVDMSKESRSSENNDETTIATPLQPTTPPSVDIDECVSNASISDRIVKEYTISNLKACEDYGLEIYINKNKTAKSNPTNFTSSERAPGLVAVNDPILSARDVKLTWNQALDHAKCVDFYKVSITGPMQKPSEEQKTKVVRTHNRFQTYAHFDQLFPCGQYEYTIIGVSLSGNDGASTNSSFDTLEAKPSPVRNHRVSEEAHNITISWDPPEFAELCLNGYRLTGWRENNYPSPEFDKVTNDTTVFIENLYACQTYTVQIIPMAKSMNDGELLQIDMETKAIIAMKSENIQALSKYPNSMELSAQVNDLNNNCETIFARFTCEANNKADVPYKQAERYVERGQVGDISFKALLGPLSPATEYKCTVAFFNIAGWSPNDTTILSTEKYFPDPPESISTKISSKSSLVFNWKSPKYANGDIKLYSSYFQRVEAAYFIPRSCDTVINTVDTRETASLELSYTSLYPYTIYSIQVAAQNDYGVGEYSLPYMMKTKPDTSEPVVNLKVVPQGPYESVSEYKANVIVSWTSPCRSNGKIEAFLLEFIGERKGYGKQQFHRSILPAFNEYGQMTHNETDLKPEFNYTVTVAVRTLDVDTNSLSIIEKFDAPSGIPEPLDDVTATKATVDAFAASNPTNSAKVRFPADVLDSNSGKIQYVALLLSEKNCNTEPQLRYGALDSYLEWPDTLTWNQAYSDDSKDCIRQYQSTPKHWNPNRPDDDIDLGEARNDELIEYVIGTEKCGTTAEYCNGPLRPDTEYYLVLRLFTKSGYSDAAILQFKTDSLIQLTVILISVIGCLLLAFIVGFIYLWITKRIVWKRESLHGIEDSFGDTIAKNFAIFYRDVSKPEKIHREFKELTVVAMDLSYTASELGCNKNRYADIFPCMPMFALSMRVFLKTCKCLGNVVTRKTIKIRIEFDNYYEFTRFSRHLYALRNTPNNEICAINKRHVFLFIADDKNRVILDIDAEGSDYINASFIDGYRRKKEYIATQGPKPESSMDFWRMILQHNVRVIVMVTQFREGDVIKCHEYFPYKSKSINVTVKKKECFEIYDRTEMSLTHDKYGLKQKVVHFYFKKWPDHGCPTDPMHLITFVRKVKAEKVPSYSPIVVHCSAGVGRTGTFIGLDIIMQRIRSESKINIYETVKKLRFQRMKMVQTLAQYNFLYACAYELVKHKSTRAALKYQNSNNKKKVSFEDDPEYNNVIALPPAPPLKFNGRRNNSDLSSVNELDAYDNNNAIRASNNYGTIPIRFNGYHIKGGLEIYDEYIDKDIDSAKVRNTESVM